MSLGVVIKGAEGLVLAADSRVTLSLQVAGRKGPEPIVNFDNATKLLTFTEPNNYVAAVTYGVAVIGLRTAHSYVPEFELTLKDRLGVLDFSKKLSAFFMKRWQDFMPKDYSGPGMAFIVGGYDVGDAYGKVFVFEVPNRPKPEPRNPGENDFGMTWGGQLQLASRIIHGYDPSLVETLAKEANLNNEQIDKVIKALKQNIEFRIPYQVLPLQDCVDLATFLIRMTVTFQDLAVGVRGVGGPIDVMTITRTRGLESVQQKQIRGEIR